MIYDSRRNKIIQEMNEAIKKGFCGSLWNNHEKLSMNNMLSIAYNLSYIFNEGERILIIPTDPVGSILFFYAAMQTGAIPMLGDPAWNAQEIRDLAKSNGAQSIIVFSSPCTTVFNNETIRSLEFGAHHISLNLDAPASVLDPNCLFIRFTSGSTGRPRALQFSGEAALGASKTFAAAAKFSPKTRLLCFATINNGLAFNTSILSVLMTGGTVWFYQGRLISSELNRAIGLFRPDVIVAFPFVFDLLARQASKLEKSINLAISASSALSTDTVLKWYEGTGFHIVDYYGLAETGPITFVSDSSGTGLGSPLPNCKIKIVHGSEINDLGEGRISVSTPYMAIGYVPDNMPSLSDQIDESGYYLTKDTGHLLESGALVLTGRVGTIANISGNKIDTKIVEREILSIPGVSAVVIKIKTGKHGNYLAAHVETKYCDDNLIRKFLVGKIPNYAIPQTIETAVSLKRSASGKVRSI